MLISLAKWFTNKFIDFDLMYMCIFFCLENLMIGIYLFTAESQVGYTPWGRPGAGAPLRSKSGKLAADYRARQVFKCSNGRMMYMD